MLSSEQEGLARYFASRGRPSGMAQFERVDWFPGSQTGVPLLTGSLAWLECDLKEVYEGGDHSIFLGLVRSARRGAGPGAAVHRRRHAPVRRARGAVRLTRHPATTRHIPAEVDP